MTKFPSFGEILLRRRKELKMTQSQLAARIGCQPNYIVYLEKGERRPSDRTVRNVASATGLDKGDLYLAANPQVREFLRIDDANQIQRDELPDGLKKLAEDEAIRAKHEIGEEEIEAVAQVRFSGRATTPEQYLTLILTLRYIFA